MEYRLGNSKKIKEAGATAELTCPKCNDKVSMSVFSNGKTDIVAELPFIINNTVYFLVCPHCGGIFTVDENAGDVFKKGEQLAIGNYDLKELKEFNIK